MIVRLYAIKDILNGFATPVMMPNDETAKRWYSDMCEENPTMKNHKEDFTVHFMGTMDTDTGLISVADEVYYKKCLTQYEGSEE